MNDENTLQFSSLSNKGQQKGNGNLWKKVTFGTTTGILLGAIGMRAIDHLKANLNEEGNGDNADTDVNTEANTPIYSDAPMAHVSNGMSFDEAFAAARAQVGPGGVFVWHNGIYGTYYETEWDAMSDVQKAEYAQSVHPPVTPEHIQVSVINEIHPEVVVEAREVEVQDNHAHVAGKTTDTIVESNPIEDEDVHIVGQGTVQGHDAVALDMTGNDEADVVIIDVDDSQSLTNPDVVVFRGGMATTIGDIAEGNPPVSLVENDHQAGIENPDVAPDIVGQGTVQGHDAVALDMTGNDEADVVIIDVDDSQSLTDPDVVVFRGGLATTIGDIAEGNPPVSLLEDEHQTGMENPDVAPDMPDYIDDGSVLM